MFFSAETKTSENSSVQKQKLHKKLGENKMQGQRIRTIDFSEDIRLDFKIGID